MSQFTENLANLLRGEAVNAGYTASAVQTALAAIAPAGVYTSAQTDAAIAAALANQTVDVTLAAGVDFVLDSAGAGTKLGTAANQKLGLWGATPIAQGAALTAQLTTITHTAPGTPDFALQNLVQNTGFGFATADEGNTVLQVVANLQARLAEVEARLEAAGIVAAN